MTTAAGAEVPATNRMSTGAKKHVFKLRFATAGGIDATEGATLQRWASLCEKRSHGQIKVDAYVNGELGSQTQTFALTQSGSLDATISASSYLTQVAPAFHVFDLPFLSQDLSQLRKVLTSPAAGQVMSTSAKADIETFALLFAGTRAVISQSPIAPVTPADFKNVKIRTLSDSLFIKEWELIGAIPTPIDTNDIYLALERGLVEDVDGVAGYAVSAKWYEVAKSFTLLGHDLGPDAVYMNRHRFLRLPESLRSVVRQAAVDAAAYGFVKAQQLESAALSTMRSAGLHVVTKVNKTPFEALTRPVYKDFKYTIGPSVEKLVVTAADGPKEASALLG